MSTIKNIQALEILDSRGNPTIETTIFLDNGMKATASVPSGASTGKYEAIELRDKDANRYNGMGVLNAVANVNVKISPKLLGINPLSQGKIDEIMLALDGTNNKANLGANAILSVSIAICKAAAMSVNLPIYAYIAQLMKINIPSSIAHMPTPTFNIINGGKHGTGNLDFQEFHVVPATTISYTDALRMGEEIYQKLKEVLISQNAIHSVGDEGGFTPNLYTNADALDLIMEAIRSTRYKYGFEIFLGLDIAGSQIYKEGMYYIKDRPTALNNDDLIKYYTQMHQDYRLLILEDPLMEEDWKGWHDITAKLGSEVLIVGDDLLVTNLERLKKAISEQACSAILIKPNQVGTLSETLAVIKLAQANKMSIIVSHRSGETNDTFIADLAVGVAANYVKFGAPARGERVAKYNRLLEIESELLSRDNADSKTGRT